MLAGIALVQALVTVFGTRGWFVALFFVVLQLTSAGAPYPIETAPTLFQVLHPLLPMSYAVEGFGALVAGGGWSLAPAVLVLFGWLVGALGVTVTTALYRVARRPLQHPGPA